MNTTPRERCALTCPTGGWPMTTPAMGPSCYGTSSSQRACTLDSATHGLAAQGGAPGALRR